MYLGTEVCGVLLCELGAGHVRTGFRPCLGLQPMDRPGAWGLWETTASDDPALGFEVLLPSGGSRHEQPRFIRYRFIWG